MTDTAELRKLAKAATPGPWIASGVTSKIGGDRFMFVNVEPLGEIARLPLPDRPAKGYAPTICDAAYIAAVSPDVLLALLDRLEAPADRVEMLEAALRTMKRFWRSRVWAGVTASDQDEIDAAFAILLTERASK
jgi:hypothetical protein